MASKLRRAQLIQSFGVGSIFSADGQTFVIKDTSFWKPKKRIKLGRLNKHIQNKKLFSFSDTVNTYGDEYVPVSRFPQWHYCSSCQKMEKVTWARDKDNEDIKSPICRNKKCKSPQPLTPMRFVAYCDNGHMAEIDWHSWAHQGRDAAADGRCSAKESELYFEAGGKSGGDFTEMFVKCKTCNHPKVSLQQVQTKRAPSNVIYIPPELRKEGQKCCGLQPWVRDPEDQKALAEECDQFMRIEPRGSASLYRPKILSALDIATEEKEKLQLSPTEERVVEKIYQKIKDKYSGNDQLICLALNGDADEETNTYVKKVFANAFDWEDNLNENAVIEQVRLLFDDDASLDGEAEVLSASINPQLELLDEEYLIFHRGEDVATDNLNVFFYRSPSDLFTRIGQVKRLKEVRVFTGFSRGEGKKTVAPDIGKKVDWLPAVEAYGEGLYFELNASLINRWIESEGKVFLDDRVNEQLDRIEKLQENYTLGIEPSVAFLVAHTISHLIIRDLTFRSGYSSSALRERIYLDKLNNGAGILIYTSDTDAEGTLGGLVEQGREELIGDLVEGIKSQSAWCSADPICRETKSQGVGGANDSACHCCSLISETSCAYQNSGLNRVLLSGLGKSFKEPLGLIAFMEQER